MRPYQPQEEHGFTLLEVLLADRIAEAGEGQRGAEAHALVGILRQLVE